MRQAKTSRATPLGASPDEGCPGFASAPAEGLSGGGKNGRDWMSAAEQFEDGRGKQAAPRDALMEAEAVLEARLAETPARRAKLRPLLALAPYVARYRGRAFLAFIA